MSIKITVRIAKGLKNNSSWTQMTWWKTNFNMPVPIIDDDKSNWVENKSYFIYKWEDTSFDFTWFTYWREAIIWVSLVELTWEPKRTLTIKQTWIDSKTQFTSSHTNIYSDTTDWSREESYASSNQWVASWEINDSFNWWNYRLKTEVIENWDVVASDITYIWISNVPTDPWWKTPWYIRVDWEELKRINASWREHTMVWISDWQKSAKPWYIWIEDEKLKYTTKWWYKRYSEISIKQFKSLYKHWAPWEVSWKKPWYIYLDNEFWWTHISMIWKDWYKYLICSWHDPYTDPY